MTSTLDLTGEEAPTIGTGHGTGALGPSDSSDSGSDVVGGPGMDEGLDDDMARQMPQTMRQGAGRDLGDADLDADTDRNGTGERGAAGLELGGPLDQQTTVVPGIEAGAEEFDDPDALALEEIADEPDAALAKSDAEADEAADADLDAAIERREGSASVSDGAT